MEISKIKSSFISNLEEKLLHDADFHILELWKEIKKIGTPIIENIYNDPDNDLVTFIFEGDEKTKNVLLMPEIKNCKFLNYKLEKLLNTNLWYLSCKIRNDIRLKYDFSINDSLDDDWDNRFENLIHDSLNKNSFLIRDEENDEDEGEIFSYVVMPKAEKHIWINENHNIPKGLISKHIYTLNKCTEELELMVYTPYGYDTSTQPYKFLVLTDGWDHINTLSAKVVLDNLIFEKKIPPIVALFIDSDDTREENFSCNDDYVALIIEELIPWFKSNYNVSQHSKDGIISGISLGGLLASYIGLNHSNVFGNILSQSGSYWYKPEDTSVSSNSCWLSSKYETIDKLPINFYLNIGVLEEDDDMIGTNRILRDVLLSKGYEVTYEEFKGGHDYLCWGETLARGLISLIGI